MKQSLLTKEQQRIVSEFQELTEYYEVAIAHIPEDNEWVLLCKEDVYDYFFEIDGFDNVNQIMNWMIQYTIEKKRKGDNHGF